MALQITQKNGTFYIKGKINTVTSESLFLHFKNNIVENSKVILNIDEINEIDRDGLLTVQKLTSLDFENNKMFSLIGNSCKEIYDDFYEGKNSLIENI